MPHLGHVIGDVISDAATVDMAVGVLVGIPVGVLAGIAVREMLEVVTRMVVDVVYTALITLFTTIIAVGDVSPVHTVRDIDPDEPSNIWLFRAVEWTQECPQSRRLNDFAPQNI